MTTDIMFRLDLSHYWILDKTNIRLERATRIETTSGRYVHGTGYLAYGVDFVRF
jgi:hypothetical protein